MTEMNAVLLECVPFIAGAWIRRMLWESRLTFDEVMHRVCSVLESPEIHVSIREGMVRFGLDEDLCVPLTEWSDREQVRLRAIRTVYRLTTDQDLWARVETSGGNVSFHGFAHDAKLNSERFTSEIVRAAFLVFTCRLPNQIAHAALHDYVHAAFSQYRSALSLWPTTTTTSLRAPS